MQHTARLRKLVLTALSSTTAIIEGTLWNEMLIHDPQNPRRATQSVGAYIPEKGSARTRRERKHERTCEKGA